MVRKGQGISINVIVIAAIALLILVILSTLVIRSSGRTNEATNSCEALENADCFPEASGCDVGYTPYSGRGCTQEGQICCIRI